MGRIELIFFNFPAIVLSYWNIPDHYLQALCST